MTATPPDGLAALRPAVPPVPLDDGLLLRQPVPRTDDDRLVEQLLAEVRQLREAVESRDVIGQAKGIVMVGFRCSPDTAFDVLCRMSQNTNRKVRDVATLVVATVVHDRPLPDDLQATLLTQLRARPR